MKTRPPDLFLPVFKTPAIPPKRLSMSDYARFVQFGWEHAGKRDEQLQLRRTAEPVKRFRLP